MFSFATVLAFWGFVTGSHALASTQCPDKYQVLDNTMFQTIPNSEGCMMSVSPRGLVDMTYRNFLFQENGLFMIFNSFNNGPEDASTGAREYYFFPRTQAMSYAYDAASKRLRITNAGGKVFEFNTEKTILVSISGTEFSMDYEVTPNNGGGVNVTRNDGMYLDLGFQLGQSPSQNPSRKITFKDGSAQKSCSVKNAEFFDYTVDQDTVVKHDDSGLKKFLSKRCPSLKF